MRERIPKSSFLYRMAKWFDHISVQEWKEKYLPVNENELPMNGVFYQFLKRQTPSRIWTVCDDGESCIIESGWHIVNAMGVYLTVIPCERDTLIYVYDEKDETADADGESGNIWVNP